MIIRARTRHGPIEVRCNLAKTELGCIGHSLHDFVLLCRDGAWLRGGLRAYEPRLAGCDKDFWLASAGAAPCHMNARRTEASTSTVVDSGLAGMRGRDRRYAMERVARKPCFRHLCDPGRW